MAEPSPDDDVIMKLARFGSWFWTWIAVNGALPEQSMIDKALLDYHLATLNPDGPGVVLTDAAARTLPVLVNADDCHP